MRDLLKLFLTFTKINLLSTSGPASAGLLHEEAVGVFMTEEEFVQAIGFSSALPGSDALQLAMFVGHSYGGIAGALVACAAAILPPTITMLGVVSVLQHFQKEAWMGGFIKGITPVITVLLSITAIKVLGKPDTRQLALLAGSALLLVGFKVPSTLVLLVMGLIGVYIYG